MLARYAAAKSGSRGQLIGFQQALAMNSNEKKAADTSRPARRDATTNVADQAAQVKDKVEQCAVELTGVNAVLKQEIPGGVQVEELQRALDQSEKTEAKVHEAAQELADVNETLAIESDERKCLERKLSTRDSQLTASKAREKESRHLALHDAITNLPNLTLFNDRLRVGLAQAQRHAWRLAVMFIDLDDFKGINDAYVHDVGDRVLRAATQRMQAAVRGGDTVCRRSGDEFLFLMLKAGDEKNVAAVAAKIAGSNAEHCEIDGVTLSVKPSIGIPVYPEDGKTAEELLKNADTAMYVAKRHKRGPSFYGRTAAPPTAAK